MRPNKDRRTEIILYGLLLIPLLFTAAALAQATEQAQGLAEITAVLSEILHTPSMLRWCASTPKFLLAVLVLYPLAVYCYMLDQADRHPGAEHGTAKWGSAHRLNIKYRNTKAPKENYILTENVRFSTDSHAHKHNLNIIVIGGSGSGKTRFYVKPNALQLIGSYLFLDPKGELLRTQGRIMEMNGISVTVLDLVHFQGHYNPMAYLETDEDAIKLMMDEFANVALPKNFKNILAVCRSRNISCDIILQNIAQLKSLFKDDWEGIIGNCDTLLYLGGNEYGTYEYLSKILGKETERTKSQSIGKGSRGSSSDSLQTAGRELCMPDEIRRMRDDECLLLMRSEDPVIDRKYNLLKHPNVKYTPDAGGEPYVIPPDYMGDAITITMGAVAAATAPEITEEMYEQLDYLEKHPEENYYENEENFSQYDQGD